MKMNRKLITAALATALAIGVLAVGPAASEEKKDDKATASETPAQPDLSGVDQYAQATAALMAGATKPSDTGRSKYATAFGVND